ncbi:MAG: hypothetical protein R6V58_16755 [Planctomycetota bacterium]
MSDGNTAREGAGANGGDGSFGRDVAIIAGAAVAGAAVLVAAFPGRVLPSITHRLMGLPGPGSGVCAVFGPAVMLLALVVHRFVPRRGAILIFCLVLGVAQNALMPVVSPGAKTVGTVGPFALRVLAVAALGAFLEEAVYRLRRRPAWLRYPASAIPANVAFLLFYWAAIYPLAGKPGVKLRNAAVLLAAAAGAAVIASLIPLLIRWVWPRSAKKI